MANRKRAFPDCRKISVCEHLPLMKIPKIDTQHPGPKNEIYQFQNGRLLHRRKATILHTNGTYPSEN